MYQQVFGCCDRNQDASKTHTMEVVAVERRFEGGTTIVGGQPKQPAIFLTPEQKVQNETVWRSNAVAQPVKVVFTYTNRYNEARQVPVSPQPRTVSQQSPIMSTVVQQPSQPVSTHYQHEHAPITTTSGTIPTIMGHYQQKSVTQQTIVRKTWEQHRQVRQEQHVLQNFNTFGPARSIEYTQSLQSRQAIGHQRVNSPVSVPTPIDILHKDNFMDFSHQQGNYFQHQPPKQEQQTLTITDPVQPQPPAEEEKKQKLQDNFIKKKTAMNKPKKQGKRPEKQDTSRSEKSSASASKRKETSASHNTLQFDKKKLSGVSSLKKLPTTKTNHLSDRLLEHRPCGRRHCTACELKKKATVDPSPSKPKNNK